MGRSPSPKEVDAGEKRRIFRTFRPDDVAIPLPRPPGLSTKMPSEEPERTAEAVPRPLPELLTLERYERRALGDQLPEAEKMMRDASREIGPSGLPQAHAILDLDLPGMASGVVARRSGCVNANQPTDGCSSRSAFDAIGPHLSMASPS